MKTTLTPIASEQKNYVAHTSEGELKKLVMTGPYQDELGTSDLSGNELLRSIYDELQKLNVQMATITGNYIDEVGY